MSSENIVDTLLNTPLLKSIIGNNWAYSQLNSAVYPGVVFNFPTDRPTPNLAAHRQATPQRAEARVQVNPLATDIGKIIQLRNAIRAAMDNKVALTVAGHKVISCRLILLGQISRDDQLGVWTQPMDFWLRYYE